MTFGTKSRIELKKIIETHNCFREKGFLPGICVLGLLMSGSPQATLLLPSTTGRGRWSR